MDIQFLLTSVFEKSYKALKKKYPSIKEDLDNFKLEFSQNPKLGVEVSEGYRKIRIAIKSKNKGKSGGARIIVYEMYLREENNSVVLIDIYDKSEAETMSERRCKDILNDFIDSLSD